MPWRSMSVNPPPSQPAILNLIVILISLSFSGLEIGLRLRLRLATCPPASGVPSEPRQALLRGSARRLALPPTKPCAQRVGRTVPGEPRQVPILIVILILILILISLRPGNWIKIKITSTITTFPPALLRGSARRLALPPAKPCAKRVGRTVPGEPRQALLRGVAAWRYCATLLRGSARRLALPPAKPCAQRVGRTVPGEPRQALPRQALLRGVAVRRCYAARRDASPHLLRELRCVAPAQLPHEKPVDQIGPLLGSSDQTPTYRVQPDVRRLVHIFLVITQAVLKEAGLKLKLQRLRLI